MFYFSVLFLLLCSPTLILFGSCCDREKKHDNNNQPKLCSSEFTTQCHQKLLNHILIRFHGTWAMHIFLLCSYYKRLLSAMKTGNNYLSLPRIHSQYHRLVRSCRTCLVFVYNVCICEYLFFVKHLFALSFFFQLMQHSNTNNSSITFQTVAVTLFARHFGAIENMNSS